MEEDYCIEEDLEEQMALVKQLQQEKQELEKCLKEMLDMNIEESNKMNSLIEWLEEKLETLDDEVPTANQTEYLIIDVLNKIKGSDK